jgi:putative hydrolase of HD superfamily
MNARLSQQIAFLVEADKLKSVVRRTPLVDTSRLENSAEHSWHLVLVIMIMRDYGPAGIDWMRVMEMAVVHDLVEIDAGDVSAYDVQGLAAKQRREQAAADRIFGLLPGDQRDGLRKLWDEFERNETPEARYANAVDRLQPLLQNEHAGGGSWCTQVLQDTQVLRRMAPIEEAMPAVWPHVLDVIEAFCHAGIIRRTRPPSRGRSGVAGE